MQGADGRATGTAFVEFLNPEDAKRAMAKDRQGLNHTPHHTRASVPAWAIEQPWMRAAAGGIPQHGWACLGHPAAACDASKPHGYGAPRGADDRTP